MKFIDLPVSAQRDFIRDYLGYGGQLSKTQISDKLRRATCTFVREKLQFELRDKMILCGGRTMRRCAVT